MSTTRKTARTPARKTAPKRAPRATPLARLRKLCLALPEAHEKIAWGTPTFRVKNKVFAMYANDHHGSGRETVWIKAAPGEQELRIAAAPSRFFRPPYVGPNGWVGVYLDKGVDWADLGEQLSDGWRMLAPKTLLARLDA